jgi:nickel/cobalt exporter
VRRLSLLVGAVILMTALAAPPAGAHPLGNFTINRFAGLEVGTHSVTIHYVVDMAEIPTLQTAQGIDMNADRALSAEELDTFASRFADEIRGNMDLTADGEAVPLTVNEAGARLTGGQGGLDVLRVELSFGGWLNEAQTTLQFNDANYTDRIGWKEVVAFTRDGQGIESSTVPAASSSDSLRHYPRDLLASPPEVTAATIRVDPSANGVTSSSASTTAAGRETGLLGGAFVRLVGGELSAGFLVVALLTAAGIGALHALGPGHGKSVMAAYLIAANGRVRHAIMVGTAISIMHTISVLALGMATLWAARAFPPERVYPWLSFASGIVVLGLGTYLLSTRIRARRRRASHDHAHVHGPDHAHDHDHGFGRHSHDLPSGTPLSWRGMGALAVSGGLLPSPSALVVLLGAVAIQRVAFGLTLVAAFSVGLAASLTLLGILILRARSFATRRLSGRAMAALPVLSALVIVGVGVVLTARAVVVL